MSLTSYRAAPPRVQGGKKYHRVRLEQDLSWNLFLASQCSVDKGTRGRCNHGMHSLWIFVSCAFIAFGPFRGTSKEPNVVLLVADDLGYGELGVQGYQTDIPTPHLDRLAASGTRFTQAYVTAPYCAASRAGFMTGRYQTRFGFEFNPIGARNMYPEAGLPPSETTIAELLRDRRGYATGLIGKWHLGGAAKFTPLRSGFDYFYGFTHEGHYFLPAPYDDAVTWLRRKTLPGGGTGRWRSGDRRLWLSDHMGHNEPAYDADNPILRNGQPVVESRYLTDAFTEEAVGFIERNRERPFFLYLAYNAVHSPLQALVEDMDRVSHIPDIQRQIFAAMLVRLDDSVGQVLSTLEGAGLADETIVVFFSDNGGPTRELTSSNGPLRGGKGQVYEGGLRVPFAVRWPGVTTPGKVEPRPVSSLDVFATVASAAGIQLSASERESLDGVDLRPYLVGEQRGDPHEELFWRLGSRAALRQGDWKVVRQSGEWELYDLSSDPSESQDLASQRPDKLKELVTAWGVLNGAMIPALF